MNKELKEGAEEKEMEMNCIIRYPSLNVQMTSKNRARAP